jgi:hypothetical protein
MLNNMSIYYSLKFNANIIIDKEDKNKTKNKKKKKKIIK